MKNKISFLSVLGFFFLAVLLIGFQSCGDDDVTGCMDSTADNYNPEATVDSGDCTYSGCTDPDAENYNVQATNDDGNCVYARDKFIGSYLSVFTCPGTLMFISNDSLVITIEPSLDATKKDEIILSLAVNGIAVPLRGTVDGDLLTISDELLGVSIPHPTFGTIQGDVVGEGSATLTDNNMVLDGSVTVSITTAILPIPLVDSCTILGDRQ